VNGYVSLAKVKLLVTTLLLLLLVSCISFTLPSPYENFQILHNLLIGRKIDDPDLLIGGWTNPKELIKVVRLPNGHDEYYYVSYWRGGQSTCRAIYEVNPETRIIVGFRWEGTEKDCGIQP